ncbi:hypothetical protein MRX96_015633 [Rhipicephalus microplus]
MQRLVVLVAALFVLETGIVLVKAQRRQSFCTLLPSSGNCYSHYVLYFYDTMFRRCRRFVYGGCGGNANRFRTLRICRRICEEADQADDMMK